MNGSSYYRPERIIRMKQIEREPKVFTGDTTRLMDDFYTTRWQMAPLSTPPLHTGPQTEDRVNEYSSAEAYQYSTDDRHREWILLISRVHFQEHGHNKNIIHGNKRLHMFAYICIGTIPKADLSSCSHKSTNYLDVNRLATIPVGGQSSSGQLYPTRDISMCFHVFLRQATPSGRLEIRKRRRSGKDKPTSILLVQEKIFNIHAIFHMQ